MFVTLSKMDYQCIKKTNRYILKPICDIANQNA